MKIALVDDEMIQLQRLKELISEELTASFRHLDHRIDAFRSGQVFLDHWVPGNYDVIILDIFMGGITGVEVARKIREEDQDVRLVFCSRSNEFAAESYQVNAQYYLVKPATRGSISGMFSRLNLDLMDRKRTITLPDGHAVILRDILYTEYYNHVVSIYLKGSDAYRLRTTQAQLEELLNPNDYFCSINRGNIINFYEVDKLDGDSFVMTDGTILPISRRKVKDVLSAYTKFRFQKMHGDVEP